MSLDIRPAAPEDAPAACTVLRRSIQECCAQDHCHDQAKLDAWLGNKTPAQVAAWMSAPANHMLVAVRDGALVGVALITQAGKLSLCYVLPEAQRHGVGTALLDGVEAKAREWGVGVLQLKSTTVGAGFYARHGYVNAGKDKTCYGLECDVFWKKLGADPGAAATPGKRFCSCTGT